MRTLTSQVSSLEQATNCRESLERERFRGLVEAVPKDGNDLGMPVGGVHLL